MQIEILAGPLGQGVGRLIPGRYLANQPLDGRRCNRRLIGLLKTEAEQVNGRLGSIQLCQYPDHLLDKRGLLRLEASQQRLDRIASHLDQCGPNVVVLGLATRIGQNANQRGDCRRASRLQFGNRRTLHLRRRVL